MDFVFIPEGPPNGFLETVESGQLVVHEVTFHKILRRFEASQRMDNTHGYVECLRKGQTTIYYIT